MKNQRHLFSLDPEAHYLNNAYMAPLLKEVEEIGIKELQRRRNPFEYELSDFFEPVKELKSLFADLIAESDWNRVSVIPSASYGLANAAKNVIAKTNGNVILLQGQFPSNYYIWKRLCDDYNMKIKSIAQLNSSETWSDQVLESINKETSAVSIPQVHWADGSLFDLETISKRCKEVDAFLIIDGTQSIGAMEFDHSKIKADAVICAGYKWLMGPYGLGLAWYGDKYDDGIPIEENWFSRKRSDEFSDLVDYEPEHREGAWKYNVGESSNFIYVQMLIACLKQINEWDPKEIQQYAKKLINPYLDSFVELGCKTKPESQRSNHLFGITTPVGFNAEAFQRLSKDNKVYTSQRGKYIRVSPHVYAREEDLEALLNCLSQSIEKT